MTSAQIIIILLALVCAGIQLADAYTTWWILSRPGGQENNPIMRAAMRAMGLLPALVVTKGPLIAFCLWAAWQHLQDPASVWWYGLPLLVAISATPLPGNFKAMRSMRARGL